MTRSPLLPLSFVLLWTLCTFFEGQALVISPPRESYNQAFPSPQSKEAESGAVVKLRVRSTKIEDIGPISGLLSNALLHPDGASPEHVDKQWNNWKARMEVLRLQAGVEKLLQSRASAIAEGQKVFETSSQDIPIPELNTSEQLRLLWSNAALRQKIGRAASESLEPHVWKGHNFDVVPHDLCWLQHKMLTAEIAETGAIVGFCEVAMLSSPDMDEECSIDAPCAPTILNLVTSPFYRRQGIASRLLQSVSRFVRQEWSHEQHLSLYVDKENKSAVSMYKRAGFETKGSVGKVERRQWYMSRPLKSSLVLSRKPVIA